MKFKVEQQDFYKGINVVQRAVANKQTMPILTGIHLEAEQNKGLHLTATDLELGIENWIEADIEVEGSIVLPSRQLSSIIRELPSSTIDVRIDLETYQAELKCLASEFSINGYDPEEFPQLPEVNVPTKLILEAGDLRELINEVKFSTSSDEAQPALTGAMMVIRDNLLKLVSTNTYRLAYSQLELPEPLEEEAGVEVILPGNTLDELSHLLNEGDVKILVNSNYISFRFNDIIVVSRLIEGKFPNYNQVIPDDYQTQLTIERQALKKAVKRVSLIARLDSNVLTLSIEDNKMIINSVDSDSGHAHEELELQMEGSPQTINIDADYLMDVLKVLTGDNIIIELIDSVNPLVVKKATEDNYIYLIMPVRSG